MLTCIFHAQILWMKTTVRPKSMHTSTSCDIWPRSWLGKSLFAKLESCRNLYKPQYNLVFHCDFLCQVATVYIMLGAYRNHLLPTLAQPALVSLAFCGLNAATKGKLASTVWSVIKQLQIQSSEVRLSVRHEQKCSLII